MWRVLGTEARQRATAAKPEVNDNIKCGGGEEVNDAEQVSGAMREVALIFVICLLVDSPERGPKVTEGPRRELQMLQGIRYSCNNLCNICCKRRR